ncbi:serine/threonine-protein kinase [Actinomadura sp. K4S16]|uniref:serine/threonine-protein kinase n=1 Tax=Actinomadura sp. K4S16 TaxID=1316147 RepID=UPI00190F6E88|nr:serine/threonine-protein kinase [Actinomadura sp. K4S16]
MQLLGGRYELTAPLGRGGMGEVWEAVDRQLERRVAVKLLTNEAIMRRPDPSELVRRFAREAELTAGLQHPGVPAVHDAGSTEDGLFLVMELVDGCTVADLVAEQGPLPVAWAAAIAAQVCSVLAIAHGRSLVHRDIKPQNLMVTRDGTVKVLDFGVATVLDAVGVVRITRTGETVGTPAYMAPEQLRSERATPRTDLYALGCVLYEILAGKPVFTATSPHALSYKHLEEDPAPLHRADVPLPLEDLVRRLLAKDPRQRPGDAREVYERLLVFVQGVHPLGDVDPALSMSTGMQLHARVLVRLAGADRRVPLAHSVSPSGPPPMPAGFAPFVTSPSIPSQGPAHMPDLGPPPPWEPRMARRGFGWKLGHSLWMVPTLAFGFLTWLSFLYIGVRHRRRAWLITAALYGVSTVASGAFIVTTTDEKGVTSTPAALFWLALFLGGVMHAAGVNPGRLRLRAHLDARDSRPAAP